MCKTSNVDDYVRSFCWLNRSSPLIRNSGRDFWKLAAGIYIYVYQLIVCEDSATLHSHYVYSWNCSVSLEIDGTGLILDKGVQWSNKIQLSNQRQWKTMAVSWLVFSNSWISGNPLFFAAFHGMFPENSIRNFFEWFSFWEKTTFFSTEIWIRSIFFISSRDGDSRWVSMCKSPTSNTTTQCGHWVFGGFLLERWRCGVWHVTLEEKSFNKEN